MAEVKIIYLPSGEGGRKQGVDDYLAAGHDVDDLLALTTEELREPITGEEAREDPETQSAFLVRCAEEADLFRTPDDEAFVTFVVDEDRVRRETHPVRSKTTKLWLQRRFYREHNKPPGAQALQEALDVLESKARFDGEEREVHVRVAEHEGAIYVDLANGAWEAVKITSDGVEVVADPPVRFRRRKGMLELPHPAEGGSVEALRRFVNVKDEQDWRLLLAWLVQAFRPTGPYPVLILQGEQGSAKTTLARTLRAIVDPSTAPVRAVARGEHDLVIAANNSWVVALDNLSGLAPWLSDALCRLSTGGGFGTRTLYENDEETLFDATRPVVLNGITDVTTRADLLDRAVILVLSPIPEEERRPEAELWHEFEEALPEILGGLFGAVSDALSELPNVELFAMPRMADFAKWATAAERGLGMEPGEFMEAYAGSRQETNELALEADPVAVAVVKLMADKDEWVGTPTALWKELSTLTDDEVRRTKAWPKAPNVLSGRLKRLAPGLRSAAAIEVEDVREAGTGERKKRLFKKTPGKDRHKRHDSHAERKAHEETPPKDDRRDGSVTVVVDEGIANRHSKNPIGTQDSAKRDNGDGRDDEMQALSTGEVVTSPLKTTVDYELITDHTRLKEVISDLGTSARVGLDLETTGLRWWEDQIRLASITTESGRTWVIDAFRVDTRPLFPALKKTKVVAHNAQFDLLFLRRMGFESEQCSCTMVLSQILWAGKETDDKSHGLRAVAKRALGTDLDKEQQTADWSGSLSPEMLAYAARDSKVLLALHDELTRLIEEVGDVGWVVDIEERLLRAVVRMADEGVPVDRKAWERYVDLVREEKDNLISEMDAYAETLPEAFATRNAKNKDIPQNRKQKVNWQSPEQRVWVLKNLGFDLPLTEKGKPSTGKDALKKVDHPLARLIERFNEIRNAAQTFGEILEDRVEGDRLHCDWRQNEAATGRMSCRKPPLQGVPSEGALRKAIKAPPDHKLVVSDLSQIEVRVLAALSGDQELKEAFEKGLDIHRTVACTILGHEEVTEEERKIAKAIVFGNMYGQRVEGMRRQIENRLGRSFPLEEAEEYWDSFFDSYPGIKHWREGIALEFELGERETRTRKGRRRIQVDTKPKRWNTPIQGLAADTLKAIAVEVHERREEIPGLELVALVHDEVICVVPEDRAQEAAKWLTDIMEAVADCVVNADSLPEERVPMKADTSVRESWGGK